MPSQATWICTLCGYTYGETLSECQFEFETLGDDWACPACFAPKAMFALCRCVTLSACANAGVCAHYLGDKFKDIGPQEITDFLEQLSGGVEKSKLCPIYNLACSVLDKWKQNMTTETTT